MMTLMKSIFKISILLISVALLAGCSDWVTPESIEIEKNSIENSNPELYAKYCEALKEYKRCDHNIIYTTYYNTQEIAANGSEKISMLPDSVDFVQLMNLEVSANHLQEIDAVRNKIGTRFTMRFSYDDCVKAYDAYVEEVMAEAEGEDTETSEETAPEIIPFEEFYADELHKVTDKIKEYGLDGFTFAFNGKNIDGMTETQKVDYTAVHDAAIAPVKEWISSNSSILFFLEGNPQYILDADILNAASYFILPTRECRNIGELALYGINAYTSGKLPEGAKMLYAVETPSFLEEEYLVGQFVFGLNDMRPQLPLTADWIVKDASYTKSGIAIWNVQRDYFNAGGMIYPNVRKAIKTMNPNE